MSVEFNVLGGRRLSIAYAQAASKMRDFRPAFKEAKGVAQQAFDDTFTTQGGSIGASWPKLSAKYAARKGGGQAGVLSGKMRRSFTSRIRAIIGKRIARYGSTNVAAGPFAFGRPGKQPARVMALWGSRGEDGLFKAVDNQIGQALRAFGRGR